MNTRPLYAIIASTLDALDTCTQVGNLKWQRHHKDRLDYIARNHLPSGSGFDNGTKINEASTPNRLVLDTAFHHMKDGSYTRWSEHAVIITPDLVSGFDLKVTGRNVDDIKSYIDEVFAGYLTRLYEWHAEEGRDDFLVERKYVT